MTSSRIRSETRTKTWSANYLHGSLQWWARPKVGRTLFATLALISSSTRGQTVWCTSLPSAVSSDSDWSTDDRLNGTKNQHYAVVLIWARESRDDLNWSRLQWDSPNPTSLSRDPAAQFLISVSRLWTHFLPLNTECRMTLWKTCRGNGVIINSPLSEEIVICVISFIRTAAARCQTVSWSVLLWSLIKISKMEITRYQTTQSSSRSIFKIPQYFISKLNPIGFQNICVSTWCLHGR